MVIFIFSEYLSMSEFSCHCNTLFFHFTTASTCPLSLSSCLRWSCSTIWWRNRSNRRRGSWRSFSARKTTSRNIWWIVVWSVLRAHTHTHTRTHTHTHAQTHPQTRMRILWTFFYTEKESFIFSIPQSKYNSFKAILPSLGIYIAIALQWGTCEANLCQRIASHLPNKISCVL